jgi:FKBP-type peptidyl-prolyl cis-trans isomerase 2
VVIKINKSIRKNRFFDRSPFASIIFLLFILVTFTGCRTAGKVRTIAPGDIALVDFTCRNKVGRIVMTTDAALAEDENKAKADIFLPLKGYGPVPMTAGSGKRGPDYGKLKTLENEILESLSLVIVGMNEGSGKIFEIASETMPGLTEEERFIRLSRIRRQPKLIKVHPVTFEKTHGKEPVPGDTITSKEIEETSMTVLSLKEEEVQLGIYMKDGMKMDLPLGEGTVYDMGDHYETIIDIHEGQLIRSGAIVGRVIDVEGEMFTIDYGHPFGNETLYCDVVCNDISDD